jgi:acyl carrier protein
MLYRHPAAVCAAAVLPVPDELPSNHPGAIRAGADRRQLTDQVPADIRKERAQVETVINDYISQEFVQDPALLPLANETSLLESGILDSLSLLQLVVFLEDRFGIAMDDADLLPKNFASVNTICAYLRAREPRKQGAARG